MLTENPMAQKLYRMKTRVRVSDRTTEAVEQITQGHRALLAMAAEAEQMRSEADAAGDSTDAQMWEGIRMTLLAATEHTEAVRRLTAETRRG
jgi:hypothetical protein